MKKNDGRLKTANRRKNLSPHLNRMEETAIMHRNGHLIFYAMNRQSFILLSFFFLLLTACTSVEEQQRRLEQARTEYRVNELNRATTEAQEKFNNWLKALDSVAYAKFHRTEETLGDVVPPVKAVKVTGKELKELVAILRRGRPVPLPDADIYTSPGSEPLQLNDDGEVVYVPVPLNQMQEYLMPPRNFFSIDMLYLYDANGNVIEPGVYPFGDIVSSTVAAQKRNSWTINNDRPFIMLDDADFKRYRSLPSYRLFVQRMKKAHSTGKWDVTPRFDELL
ncbi:MAG: hypothetical protein Q4F40_06720 [Akkermansia sp.]|nr:hypothetical protein [Akkermansia sp.]